MVNGTQIAIGMIRLTDAAGIANGLAVTMSSSGTGTPAFQKLRLSEYKWRTVVPNQFTDENIFYVIGTPQNVLTRLTQIRTDGGDCLN